MLLLRSSIGGRKASERRSAKEELKTLPDWDDNVTFTIYGQQCRMRRRICQFSTRGELTYSYSGLKNVVAPEFPQILLRIKRQVEDKVLELINDGAAIPKNMTISPKFAELAKAVSNDVTGESEIFNYCLCNHYRSGDEYMGYHADDETSLDVDVPIASVSLGITRSFDIRPRVKGSDGKRSRVARVALGDGDLLLLFSPMQDHYEHGIPVEKRIAGERINLTFRRINSRAKR